MVLVGLAAVQKQLIMSAAGAHFDEDKSNLNNLKKNLTLDFNQTKLNLNLPLSVLSSPDINMLKMNTPEIENMLMSNTLPNTPTPSVLFPRNVTAEQETFAGGFVEALNNLHNGNSQHGTNTDNSNTSTVFDPTNFVPVIKEEPQTVPTINTNGTNGTTNTPPMSPVDMEYQERMKLERKRQRNRLAASKCRSRKLERISKLEDKVKVLKGENAELASLVNQLKEHVGLLKLEVMEHANAGCQIVISQY